MRIAAIEELAALSPVEAKLLDHLLEGASERATRHPARAKIERATLAVYVVTRPDGQEGKIVAPASGALRVGMAVVASGFTMFTQQAPQNSGTGARLDLAAALRPDDRDL